MDKYKFGEFIYKMRSECGLTQDELGRKLGVTNKAVSKWEVGETLPDINLMPLLADALGVTIDELYSGEKRKEEPIVIEKRKKPVLLIVSTSILAFLVFITTSYIVLNEIKSRLIIEDTICVLDNSNYQDYLVITPIYRSVNEGSKLTIYGKVELQEKTYFKSPITINLTYSIQYFYINNDNQSSLISYLNKKKEIILDNSRIALFELNVEPVNDLNDFKDFKEFVFDYRIDEVNGQISLIE
ncbi:MAG: helix-turn-helix transcriptional regulator [Bacillales bacterium]|nr:helix-turn-helix transcriptional regulator [Bacillales bacterium]